MTGEKINYGEAAATQAEDASERKHERSSIGFPYLDLDTAVEVARAVQQRAGFGTCTSDELAAELGQTVSGAFRLKIGTARTFGVVERDGRSDFRLTELGRRLVQPSGERPARVEAFLTVPLYHAIYEKYRGHHLPPARALEREMQALGVSGKQTSKARQAFERSARQAGFFASGDDRLVKPRVDGAPESPSGMDESLPEEPEQDQTQMPPRQIGDFSGDALHPFIVGLLQSLPQPGEKWSNQKRADWLRTAAHIFKLIYEGDGEIEIKAAPQSAPYKDSGYVVNS